MQLSSSRRSWLMAGRLTPHVRIESRKRPKRNRLTSRYRQGKPPFNRLAGNRFIPKHAEGMQHGIQTELQSSAGRARPRKAGEEGSEIAGTRGRRGGAP